MWDFFREDEDQQRLPLRDHNGSPIFDDKQSIKISNVITGIAILVIAFGLWLYTR